MDNISGWHEVEGRSERHDDTQIGGRLTARIWIHSENCDMQCSKAHGSSQRQATRTIKEAVMWVCANVHDDHDRVSEFSLVMHENDIFGQLNFDLDVSRIVRWSSWYSCPTELNNFCTTRLQIWYLKRPSRSFFPTDILSKRFLMSAQRKVMLTQMTRWKWRPVFWRTRGPSA